MRALIIATSIIASTAQADISVRFDEGAPKDRFTLTHTGTCDLDAAKVTLDLSTSPHGLIFDVTAQGQGVEVFQPFELIAGASLLAAQPVVQDGDQTIALPLSKFETGQRVAFTIDVDDTAGARETIVSDSEIEGATVVVTTGSDTYTGAFDKQSNALVRIDNCTS